MTIRLYLPVLAFLAAFAGFGQTQPAAKPAPAPKKVTKPVATTHGSANRLAPSDTQIEKDIRARFAASKIAADKFEVHVQGGRATMTGKTDVLQHKGRRRAQIKRSETVARSERR